MLHASYEIWGFVLVALFIGILIVKVLLRRRRNRRGHELLPGKRGTSHSSDFEHRALMFLMAQKTDSVLAALAQAIDQERQKLGGVVRNPSMAEALDAIQAAAPSPAGDPKTNYERVIPMASSGMDEADIARQLQLPEAEVSLVMRLNAA
ncbi:hypothetical protein DSCW_11180 [Desulfosarcina widdelii]|uniref:DUF2802 domain-containing protein n=1 Tax=Desulfosarcina widdelii TaxID=947919 RepID=A0A5K7Z2F1_9BACT|nr:hypothetical protein [Desulfosarcina widdelii]BBO73701.1 hypothetical protein DSCW_11180 [Desulfosarcina widdelii]